MFDLDRSRGIATTRCNTHLFYVFLVLLSCYRIPTAEASVSAYVIDYPDLLLSGAWVYGQIGDIMLENDLVAVVVSAIDHPQLDALSGGNIVDAGSSVDRINALGNFYTYFNDDWPRQAIYTTLTVVDDGSAGGPAIVRVSGMDSIDPSLTVTTDYSLADSAAFLTVSTTVTNTGSGTYSSFELGDSYQWGDCLKFVPGYGFSPPDNTTEPWIAGSSAHVSYGYVSPSNTLWGSHGAQWSDLNVTTAALEPGESASYSRHFGVGAQDVASVATVIHELCGTPIGFVDCVVTNESDGEPIQDAVVDVFDSSNSPYLQMEPDVAGLATATLPAGDWRLVAAAFGFVPQEVWVSITEGGTESQGFILFSDGTVIPEKGDTLTIIQRPLLNIPAFLVPGDTLALQCCADPLMLDWAAELRLGEVRVPLEISSAVYDPSSLLWHVSAVAPEVQLFELYDLVVAVSGRDQDITENAVAVIPEFKDDYYFIHITDTHLPTNLYHHEYGADTDTSEVTDLREVIADINIINPEFVLLTGDMIHEGELEDYLGHRYYTRTQRLLTEFQTPLFVTAGNHDIGGWPSTPPPAGTARRDWWRFFGWSRLDDPPPGAPSHTQDYSFDYGPVHYVGLEAYDNYDMWRLNIYGEESFTDEQLLWLENDLAQAAGSTSQVLFYHYDFADQVNLGQLGVEMALWGHIHHDSGNINSPPYNLATNNVCGGERAFRLIRVSQGILDPCATVSAGYAGNNLTVQYSPSNDGTSMAVTAEITNNLWERFEHARIRVLMPKEPGNIDVTGGTLQQVDDSDSVAICYIGVDIEPFSVQQVTITLDGLTGELVDGEVVLTWPEWPDALAYWVYGAVNDSHFEPGMVPPYEHRLAVLGQGTTSWSSSSGIGDPENNWTFLIVPVGEGDGALARLGPWSEVDFSLAEAPVEVGEGPYHAEAP
jgi:hypothetical protein